MGAKKANMYYVVKVGGDGKETVYGSLFSNIIQAEGQRRLLNQRAKKNSLYKYFFQ